MELIEKALALCAEIEARQHELRQILAQISETVPVQVVDDEPAEESPAFIQESTIPAKQRPDLRKAFTINDRFRFRRELFAGDDSALIAVIEQLSKFDTLAEADAYLSTMPWDHDSEAIEEFMTIIANHFNAK